LDEAQLYKAPEGIMSDIEEEVMKMDLNNLPVSKEMMPRLGLIVNRSANLALIKPKVERLIKQNSM